MVVEVAASGEEPERGVAGVAVSRLRTVNDIGKGAVFREFRESEDDVF